MISLEALEGWVSDGPASVRLESSEGAADGHVNARIDRLVLRKEQEDKPLSLVVAATQNCKIARLSVTLNARFLELYPGDVYIKTVRGATTETKGVFEVVEEFAPPLNISDSSRLICKVASIKGDASCVTLENVSFGVIGLRATNAPAGGGLSSLPFDMPMITAAVEAVKNELRSSILEDLRIIAEGQSMIMMSKLTQIDRRLHALETTVHRLVSAVPSPSQQEPETTNVTKEHEESKVSTGEEKAEVEDPNGVPRDLPDQTPVQEEKPIEQQDSVAAEVDTRAEAAPEMAES